MALAALAGDLGFVPSTTQLLTPTHYSRSGGGSRAALFRPPWAPGVHMEHTYMAAKHRLRYFTLAVTDLNDQGNFLKKAFDLELLASAG